MSYSEKIMNKAKELTTLSIEFGREADTDDSYFEDDLYNYFVDNDGTISTGATKAVFIFNDEDYVLKTPIFGEVSYPSIKDEYGYLEPDYDAEPNFTAWTGALYSDCGDNYCESEEYLYKKAEEAGLGELFIKTEFLYTENGRPVYISEKCHHCDLWRKGGEEAPSENSLSIAEENRKSKKDNWTSRLGLQATAKFIDDYGLEMTEKLLAFIKKYDISDLHDDNTMISNRTGKIVITDYAGFYS